MTRSDRADNLLEAPGLAASTQAGNKLLVANGDRVEYDRRDNVGGRNGVAGKILSLPLPPRLEIKRLLKRTRAWPQ